MQSESTPIRTCAGTQQKHPQAHLVRWFQGPDGTLWPDWTGRSAKVAGRGAWTLPTPEAVRQAAERGGFARALKAKIKPVPLETLLQRLVEAGERAFFSRLGLARRAGALAVGERAIREAFPGLSDGLLIAAEDGGASNRAKFIENARRKGAPVLLVDHGRRLGEALGREYVSAALVTRAAFADDLLRWAWRLRCLGAASMVEVVGYVEEKAEAVDTLNGRGKEAPALGRPGRDA